MKRLTYLFLLACMTLCGCNSQAQSNEHKPAEESAKQSVDIPQFCTDSAMVYLAKQCDFGPRVPNTKAHQQCGAYLVNEMKRLGATVTEQDADLKAFDGTVLHSKNIIAQYNPENSRRVVLFAHWDCRPFSDADPDKANWHKPVMGANDAASGVAVLMEMGRLMQTNNPGIGVDLVLVDAEDYGAPDWKHVSEEQDTWCLGAQYWSKNNGYTAQNKPQWGILLDMVGGQNPQFAVDVVTYQYASHYANDIWAQADKLGFGSVFVLGQGGSIIDDHYFINQMTGIPTVDIIDYRNGAGFPESWHTQHDDMAHIDRNTVGMVGRVLTAYLYTYAAK